MRYAHTSIVADDWRSLAGFYGAVFGCVRVPPERSLSGEWLSAGTGVADASLEGVHLRLPGHGKGGPTLEIYTYRAIEPADPGAANRRGLAHLAFEVDDVEAVANVMLEHGGTLAGRIVTRPVPGVGALTFVYARDPEGNLVELQSWDRSAG